MSKEVNYLQGLFGNIINDLLVYAIKELYLTFNILTA